MMWMLTFLTMLTGTQAFTTGVGMNFEMAFFGSERRFWISLAAMIALSAEACSWRRSSDGYDAADCSPVDRQRLDRRYRIDTIT